MRYAMGTLKVYPTKERDEEDGIQNHEREPRMDHVMPMLPGFGALVREGQRLIEKHMGASLEPYDAKFERVSCKNTGTNNRLGLPGRVRQGDRRSGRSSTQHGPSSSGHDPHAALASAMCHVMLREFAKWPAA